MAVHPKASLKRIYKYKELMPMDKDLRKKNNFEDVLQSVLAEKNNVPVDLLSKIISAIFWRQRVLASLKAAAFSVLSLGSLAVIFFATQEVIWQLGQSGIMNILSLLFSDLAVVLANWQSFVLSCLESFPVFPIVLTSGAALIFFVSLRIVVANTLKLKGDFYPNLRLNY